MALVPSNAQTRSNSQRVASYVGDTTASLTASALGHGAYWAAYAAAGYPAAVVSGTTVKQTVYHGLHLGWAAASATASGAASLASWGASYVTGAGDSEANGLSTPSQTASDASQQEVGELLKVARDCLLQVFCTNWRNEVQQTWVDGDRAGAVLVSRFPEVLEGSFAADRRKLRSGAASNWDITLLARLLRAHVPARLSKRQRAAVSLIAAVRNEYSHTANPDSALVEQWRRSLVEVLVSTFDVTPSNLPVGGSRDPPSVDHIPSDSLPSSSSPVVAQLPGAPPVSPSSPPPSSSAPEAGSHSSWFPSLPAFALPGGWTGASGPPPNAHEAAPVGSRIGASDSDAKRHNEQESSSWLPSLPSVSVSVPSSLTSPMRLFSSASAESGDSERTRTPDLITNPSSGDDSSLAQHLHSLSKSLPARP